MRKVLFVLAVATGVLLSLSSASRATTFTVSSAADMGVGTLRQAILDANGDLSATSGSPHVIKFAIAGPPVPIALTTALPDIDNHMTINGPSTTPLSQVIQGGASFRVFNILVGRTVKMSYLIISGGHVVAVDVGGGIRNAGTLTLTDCAVTGNFADFAGGGIANIATGNLTLSRVTVDNNKVTGGPVGGGGIDNRGTAKLTNCTISFNHGDGGSGGGILAGFGSLTLINCTVAKNYALSGGGGIAVSIGATVKMHNTLVALNDSPISKDISGTIGSSNGHNLVGVSTGGTVAGSDNILDPVPATIGLDPALADNGGRTLTHALQCGSLAINTGTSSGSPPSNDQRSKSRASSFDIGAYEFIPNAGPFEVTTVLDNGDNMNPTPGSLRKAILDAIAGCANPAVIDASDVNGPVITLAAPLPQLTANITIDGPDSESNSLTVDGNNVAGSIFSIASGVTVKINCLWITNGNSPDVGGGIKNAGTLTVNGCRLTSNEAAQAGAGIANLAGGTLTLERSTVDDNKITGVSVGGGGIDNKGTATFKNSTVSGNDGDGGPGGGVLNQAGSMTLTNCTVAFNKATTGAGLAVLAGTVKMSNTLVAGNLASVSNPDISGTVGSDNGHNLVGVLTGATLPMGSYIGPFALADVHIDPNLVDNDGKTPTHALLCGSPAIDAGDPAVAPSKDQRGESREGVADIGAYELIPDPGPFKVKNLADAGPGSLRQAVIDANASCADPAPITFSSDLKGTILLTSGPLDPLSGKITITGPSSGQILVSGNGAYRVFEIAPLATVAISRLTITGGNAGALKGGGIANHGNLTLTNCTIATNKSALGGAGVWNDAGSLVMTGCTLNDNGPPAPATVITGGGLCNAGSATLTNCTLSGNSAGAGKGGGLGNTGGVTTLQNCTFFGNNAANGGGAASLGGAVVLENTILIGNTATTSGNDVYNLGGVFGSANGHNLLGSSTGATLGGNTTGNVVPVASANLVLNTTLAANGGITRTHALICGPATNVGSPIGAPATDQRGKSRYGQVDIGAFELVPTPQVFVVTSTLDDGSAGTLRKAIADAKASCLNPATIDATGASGTITLGSQLLIESNLVINGPTSAVLKVSGQGMFRVFEIAATSTVTINNLTIQDGKATAADGGGILNRGTLSLANCTVTNCQAVKGGGIANVAGATLALGNCTIDHNQNVMGGPGGGLFSAGVSATLVNCTVSTNVTTATGGGIHLGGGSLSLLHCTVAQNTAPSGQGAGIHVAGGMAAVDNSIVLANLGATAKDVFGTIGAGDYNVYGTVTLPPAGTNNTLSGVVANILDVTLASNGGPTRTHALKCVKPLTLNLAVDKANPALATAADQRGQSRVDMPGVGLFVPDIGAYEFNPPTLFLVTDPGDNGNNTTPLANSLRKAIKDANESCASPVVIDATGVPGGTIGLITAALPALDNDITINGRPDNTLEVSAATLFRVFDVNAGRTVTINRLTIKNGKATSGGGGGIRNAGTLALVNCTLTNNNSTTTGGALQNSASLSLFNCTVTTNTSTGDGAGIFSTGAASSLTLEACTVDNNSTPAAGGGIRNDAGMANLKNCTVSGNRSTAGSGGGISNSGTVKLTNCTVTGNSGVTGGGGVAQLSGTAEVNNTILVGNTAGTGPDIRLVAGTIVSAINVASGNLVGTGTNAMVPGATLVASVTGVLDALSSNGGPTRTHALVSGGDAVNTGSNAVLGAPYSLTTDQRGLPRGAEGTVDIGAFESQPILGPNLVDNSSFEADLDDWDDYHESSISRVRGGRHGNWAVQVKGPSSINDYFGIQDDQNVVGSTKAGARYRFSAFVRSNAHQGTAKIRLREYDSDDKLQEVFSSGVTLAPDWQLIVADLVASGKDNEIEFEVVDVPLVPNEIFLVDHISVNVVLVADTPPIIVAPISASIVEGNLLSFRVQVVDPDGQAILSLAPLGALPASAMFVPIGTTGGTFTWTPTAGQSAGSPHHIRLRATTSSFSGLSNTDITVIALPLVNLLAASPSGFEGAGPLSALGWSGFASATLGFSTTARTGAQSVQVTGPSSSLSPFGLDDNPNVIGPLPSPNLSQGARARYRFSAWVRAVNPSSFGTVKIAIREFKGSTQVGPTTYSSPPLTFVNNTSWNQLAVEVVTQLGGTSLDMRVHYTPSASISGGDKFLVDDVQIVHLGIINGLVAGDGEAVPPSAYGGDEAEAAAELPVTRAFTREGDALVTLGSSSSPWTAGIEGLLPQHEATIPSVSMKYGGREVMANPSLTRMGEDRDQNGIEEVSASFSAAEVGRLFSDLTGDFDRAKVTLVLNPGKPCAREIPLELSLAAAPPVVFAASIFPNPIQTEGRLRFSTTRPGPVRVTMFDANGRRVRSLLDQRNVLPGRHEIALGGTGPGRTRLSSGLYFYRVESPEGVINGRFVLMQ